MYYMYIYKYIMTYPMLKTKHPRTSRCSWRSRRWTYSAMECYGWEHGNFLVKPVLHQFSISLHWQALVNMQLWHIMTFEIILHHYFLSSSCIAYRYCTPLCRVSSTISLKSFTIFWMNHCSHGDAKMEHDHEYTYMICIHSEQLEISLCTHMHNSTRRCLRP